MRVCPPSLTRQLTDLVDINEYRELATELVQTTCRLSNIVAKDYPFWKTGDTSAMFALFFDNLATQLSLAGIAVGLGFDADFVSTHFMGGVGMSIFVGNLYYSMQASKVATQSGNASTCAQPYGINTPGALAKTFGILGVVLSAELEKGVDKQVAMHTAWSVACSANFLGGFFEALGAFIAPLIARNCPQSAFLAPAGGIGMSWLGLNPLVTLLSSPDAHNAIVGFLPFVIVWMSIFGTEKLFGQLPSAGVAVALGCVLNLLVHTANWGDFTGQVANSTEFLGWSGVHMPSFSHMSVRRDST